MEHRSQGEQSERRAHTPRARGVAAWERLLAAMLCSVLLAGGAGAAPYESQPAKRSWWWFAPQAKAADSAHSINPFDRRPANAPPLVAQPMYLATDAPAKAGPIVLTPASATNLSHPASMAPDGMVVVSDQSPPTSAPPVVPERPLSQPSYLSNPSAQTTPEPNSAAAEQEASSGWTSSAGGGLMRQLLGTTAAPAPKQPTPTNSVAAQPRPAEPLAAAAANLATGEASKPESKPKQEPVAANGDAAVDLLSQLGVTGVKSAPPTKSPETDLAAEKVQPVWQALARPWTMTTNAPPIERPERPATATVAREQPPLPESERVPTLLRPFYMTNDRPAATRPAATPTMISPWDSTLAQQLTLSSGEFIKAAQDNPPDAPLDATSMLAIEPWNRQLPALVNPFVQTQTPEPASTVAGGGRTSDVQQVSFLQETLPEPNGGLKPDEIGLPGDSAGAQGGQRGDGEGGGGESLTGANQLGTAPEDTTLEFLRAATVLLKPGDSQCDVGFEYSLNESDFPILIVDDMGQAVSVDDVEFRSRELAVPLEIRYGVLNRLQVFLQVPLGWSNTQVAIDGFDAFQNDGGLGDVAFGATMQLQDATKDRPYMVGTLSGLAPTGGDPFTGIQAFSPTAPSLGNGFWAVSGNLLWIETRYDPVILFYGLGARYQFEHRYLGIEFQPGQEYNYTFGYGFAINERVTLSTQFFGSYVEEFKANGRRLEGTNQEPMTLRFALTMVDRCERIVEPFVSFGLTDDAVSASFGVTWTFSSPGGHQKSKACEDERSR